MNINVKTKIRYQGKEYASAGELPAEARAAYERAMSGTPGATAAGAISKKIVLNGRTFSNEDEMPDAERKLYDDAMKLMRDSSTAR